MNEKEKFIIKYLDKYDFSYIKLTNENEIDVIYELFKNNILPQENENTIILCYTGTYYYINKDYKNMKIYYLKSMKFGSIEAVFNLGYYYSEIKKYDKMINFYIIACNHKNVSAYLALGHYYYTIGEYSKMEKCYLGAIHLGNTSALVILSKFYYFQKKYECMKKCHNLIQDKNNPEFILNLNTYLRNHYDKEHADKFYDLLDEYNLLRY